MRAIPAQLGATLASSWTAVLAFQRPLMVLLDDLFSYAALPPMEMTALPRRAASELVLCAVLAPLAETDLSAPFDKRVFAMDASTTHGAVCSTPVPTDIARTLWQTCERRGGYTRLETRARAALRALGRLPPMMRALISRKSRLSKALASRIRPVKLRMSTT